ncbi:HNH endonuclease signature motif containing protein [Georgenia sp.]
MPVLAGLDLAQALNPVGVEGEDADALVAIAAAWSRVASWATARRGEALAELASASQGWSGGWSDGFVALSTEVAMREGISRPAASTAVKTAVMLNGPLLATGDALRDGVIDPAKAGLIARTLADLPFEVAVAVEDEVLPEAGSRTPSQLGRALNKVLITVDPEVAVDRARAAMARRRVCHPRSLPDGMASMYAVFPAADAIALDLALDGAARAARAAGDRRTTDQLRADVLASIGADALRTGSIGSRTAPTAGNPRTGGGGPLPEPGSPGSATIGPVPDDLSALLLELDDAEPPEPPRWLDDVPEPTGGCGEVGVPPGWRDALSPGPPDRVGGAVPADLPGAPPGPDSHPDADASTSTVPDPDPSEAGYALALKGGVPVRVNVTVPLSTLLGGDEPGHLDGYGAIDAVTARALAMGGLWRRLVTDPLTGVVLDAGRSRYRPPADLAELIRLRDGTCFRPGCSTAAARCELDHTTPWSHLGTTSWANLGPGCTTDHSLKTNGDFAVRQHEPGVFTWTSKLTGISYRREPSGATTVLGQTQPPQPRHPHGLRDEL